MTPPRKHGVSRLVDAAAAFQGMLGCLLLICDAVWPRAIRMDVMHLVR